MLKTDNEQKLELVLFYAAIIYHAAQIMKAKNLGLPRHLAFSGNGSRIVNIVGDKDILAAFSKSIFEKVYSQRYHTKGCPDNLEIIQDAPNPKEITCKGGIRQPIITTGRKHLLRWSCWNRRHDLRRKHDLFFNKD
jgi:hypothetical protein